MELRKKKKNKRLRYLIGGAALAAIAVGVILNLHDIKRYIKMIRM